MLRYCFKLFVIALYTLSLGSLVILLAVFDRQGKLAYQLCRLWTWLILKAGGIRLRIRGLKHLDPHQPYIFMANHQSNMDIPVLVQSLAEFQLRWIAKRELAFVPLFGWALWSSRHILVARGDRAAARTTLKKAKKKLQEGSSIMLFPEGTRSRDGKLLPFKRGGFLLALQAKMPVVPVTLNGAGTILPPGDWRIREGEVEVVIDEPIGLERCRVADLEMLMAQVRGLMGSNLKVQGNTQRASAPEVGVGARSRTGLERRHL